MTNRPEKLTDLLARELPSNPSWVEPEILPKGGTLILGGEPKVGKSFQALEFARTITTGGQLFEHPKLYAPVPAKVLLVEQEVGPRSLQKRGKGVFKHEKVSLYGERMWYVSKLPDLLLDTNIGRKLLFDLVSEIRPNVLILDPLGQMHTADENDAAAMGKLFNFLDALKEDFKADDLAIIMSHHFRKPPLDRKDFDPLDANNYRGSGRFFGNPDTIMTSSRYKEIHGLANSHGPYKAWHLKIRFKLRHGSDPDDFGAIAQQNDDGRVIYERPLGPAPKLTRNTASVNDPAQPAPDQKTFNLI